MEKKEIIDYTKERNKYKPELVKTLLIGEAPPPSGKTFFYVPKQISNNRTIENDTSLPSTIFNHYFDRRPETIEEYKEFLKMLTQQNIFLIDILDEPIKIRGNKENENYLISKIPDFREKVKSFGIELDEKYWIFLLARNSYKKYINKEFPLAQKIRWIDFRLKRKNYPQQKI